MEESPNGMLSSQVQIIGWDMNSPQTTKISPRSVILPRPAGESSSSPSGVYFIEQWGTHQRNKRRIRRPPKPNLYKRYDFTSALDSPEISDSSDFDDFSDDVLSQIRLTPLLNKTNNTCSATSGEVSPTGPGPSHMAPSKVPQVFKTPTMFKTQSRASHEQTTVQPRKLTAEFDKAKSPVQPARSNKQPATNFSRVPQRNSSNLNNPGPPNKPVFTNKPSVPGTASRPVSCSNPEIDDEDMISDDDDEVLRQADLIYASQSSQNSKAQECSKDKQPLKNERPPDCQQSKLLFNTCDQSEQNKYKQTVPVNQQKLLQTNREISVL
ncbi:uncharacterized protein LOC134826471 [Bolinopsis microptera]|uniref:uncharacterized protein LOC134826471 n=1 Tax=Bolinopsis microptera TaxID=2820187 RepID=UPI00307A63FE